MNPIDNSASNALELARPSIASYVPDQELYQKLLDQAPLLKTEDRQLYARIFDGILVDLQPQSLMEWLAAKDIVDKRFEERRYQCLKVELLEHAKKPPPIATSHDEGRALESVKKCLPHLETLSRLETNCANFRRTATKDLAGTVRERGSSPSVVPE